MEKVNLKWLDYLVITITVGISISIGIYYRFSGGRQKSTQEYFVANKSMSVFTVGVALVVSFMSAITLLGLSQENYYHGTQFVVINIAYLLSTPIICYTFLPVFYNLGATSAYEYLEKRFGYGARLTASIIYWVQLLLYSGVVLYAPSLALDVTTGMNQNWSIILIGLACAVYSSIGGIKAVLITDVFQALLMFVSIFVVIITVSFKVGGFSEIWRIAKEDGRLEFFNTSLDPTERHTIWSLVIGGMCTYMSIYGVNQVQVQRLLTVKNIKSARLALWVSLPVLCILSISTCFSGLALYSYYRKCDPFSNKKITTEDMIMPYYVMDVLSNLPGVPGLFIAGIFGASLSTISAALNSLAAVTLEDYIKPVYKYFFGHEISEKKSIYCSKVLAFMYGILCIALAFLAQLLGRVLQISLTIFGVVGGPLLGMFTLGMLTKTGNQIGSVIGTLLSVIFLFWIAFGEPRPSEPKLALSVEGCNNSSYNNSSMFRLNSANDNLIGENNYFYFYRISYMWYSVIGLLMTFTIGWIISFLTQSKKSKELDPRLLFSCVANIMDKQNHQTETKRNMPTLELN